MVTEDNEILLLFNYNIFSIVQMQNRTCLDDTSIRIYQELKQELATSVPFKITALKFIIYNFYNINY